jgi:hypothetical protein
VTTDSCGQFMSSDSRSCPCHTWWRVGGERSQDRLLGRWTGLGGLLGIGLGLGAANQVVGQVFCSGRSASPQGSLSLIVIRQRWRLGDRETTCRLLAGPAAHLSRLRRPGSAFTDRHGRSRAMCRLGNTHFRTGFRTRKRHDPEARQVTVRWPLSRGVPQVSDPGSNRTQRR